MDNFYNACPPKMNDSRFLTDYRSSKVREPFLKKLNNIEDDSEFRIFLQANGEKIISETWNVLKNNTCSTNGCLHDCKTKTTNEKLDTKLKQYTAGNIPSCKTINDLKLNE